MKINTLVVATLFALSACGSPAIFHGDDSTEPPRSDASVIDTSVSEPDAEPTPIIPEICFLQKSILNGQATDAYPAVVHLATEEGSCGAVLIHTRTLLTSAHCVLSEENMTVTINETEYNVVNKILHPLYEDSEYEAATFNDIAVLHLNEDVSGVIPIPMEAEQVARWSQVVLVGYGNTRWPNKDTGIKRVGSSIVEWVTDQTLAYEGLNTNCQGDSGGAVLIDGRLVGIMWANPYGSCDRGYAMGVVAFHDWIVENAVGTCPQ